MTQNYYEVQTVECGGIPRVESGSVVEEPLLITIEFTPKIHPLDDYSHTQPEYVFGDEVVKRDEHLRCLENQIPLEDELNLGIVTGLELVEYRSKLGRLTAEPHWLIGVRWEGVSQVKWHYECELMFISLTQTVPEF